MEPTSTLMVSSWTDWLSRARQHSTTDVFASYLMAYIALVILSKDRYIAGNDSDISPSKINQEYSSKFNGLPETSRYKEKASVIWDYFELEEHRDLKIKDPENGRDSTVIFREASLDSHMRWLRAVRNNIVHGEKSFDHRGSDITSMANELLLTFFDEIV